MKRAVPSFLRSPANSDPSVSANPAQEKLVTMNHQAKNDENLLFGRDKSQAA